MVDTNKLQWENIQHEETIINFYPNVKLSVTRQG